MAQNLQQGGIRHEEKSRKYQALLLQVTRQGLLTELQLLQEVREQLEEEEDEERRSWSESCLTTTAEYWECCVAQRQHLAERLVPHTALHHVGKLVCSLHDPLPRLVNVLETFGLLDELKTNFKLYLTWEKMLQL